MRRPELELAASLRESGDLDEAGSLLSRVLVEAPDDPEANYQMAWLCDVRGREREAVFYYVRTIDAGVSGTDRAAAYLGLGSAHRALGEYAEAVDVLRRGVAEFPGNRAPLTFLAMALHNAGEHRESVELLLGNLLATTSDPDIQSYERALTYYAGRLDEVET